MNKAVVVVLVVFLGFWMVTDPGGLADVARSAGSGGWDLTQDFFSSIITFLGEL